MNKLNLAIAGFGKAAEVYHTPFINAVPEISVKKVLERHHQKSEEYFPGVEVVKNYEVILEDPDIEAVLITTPNYLHFSMATLALEAGKHVIVDKPFTLTSEEAKVLTDLAVKNKKLITVYHNRVLDGPIRALKELIDQKVLGNPEEITIRFDRFRPEVNSDTWREKNTPGSGILYDLGSHLIYYSLYLFGYPDEVKAVVEKQRDGAVADDYFYITCNYKEPGVKVILTAGMLVKGQSLHIELKSEKGRAIFETLDPQEAALKNGILPGHPDWPSKFNYCLEIEDDVIEKVAPAGDYSLFYQNFYKAAKDEKELLVKPETATMVINLIEKVRAIGEK